MKKIGITTTIPSEIIYASGNIPIDLNNTFITHNKPSELIEYAEKKGLPSTLCSWVKGIFTAASIRSDISEIIAVVEGDCSNTLVLTDFFAQMGKHVVTFSYPFDRNPKKLSYEIEALIRHYNVSDRKIEETTEQLDKIRDKADYIDYLTWSEGKVSGLENHIYLVNMSDFEGNPKEYDIKLSNFIREAEKREKRDDFLRIGIVGVPPIFSNLYTYLESKGAKIVFNETQRQFSMPLRGKNLVDRYLAYTYPYSFSTRLPDIEAQLKLRKIDGIIHYTQTFCHHQMEHILLKESIPAPTLLLEGDRPGELDERLHIRLESFLEMLA